MWLPRRAHQQRGTCLLPCTAAPSGADKRALCSSAAQRGPWGQGGPEKVRTLLTSIEGPHGHTMPGHLACRLLLSMSCPCSQCQRLTRSMPQAPQARKSSDEQVGATALTDSFGAAHLLACTASLGQAMCAPQGRQQASAASKALSEPGCVGGALLDPSAQQRQRQRLPPACRSCACPCQARCACCGTQSAGAQALAGCQ